MFMLVSAFILGTCTQKPPCNSTAVVELHDKKTTNCKRLIIFSLTSKRTNNKKAGIMHHEMYFVHLFDNCSLVVINYDNTLWHTS